MAACLTPSYAKLLDRQAKCYIKSPASLKEGHGLGTKCTLVQNTGQPLPCRLLFRRTVGFGSELWSTCPYTNCFPVWCASWSTTLWSAFQYVPISLIWLTSYVTALSFTCILMHNHASLQYWDLLIPGIYSANHLMSMHSSDYSHSVKWTDCQSPKQASMYGHLAAIYSHSAKFQTF